MHFIVTISETMKENIIMEGIDKKSVSVLSSYLISVEECWYPDYIGDGNCQDVNNHIGCNFDGGDCCGSCVNMEFCIECLCLSEQNSSTGGQVCNKVGYYIGDGYCVDWLNKAECNFDGGDCCDPNANTDYCSLCQCVSGDNGTTISGTFLAA